jgi:Spy/CpxP family protein refolding chaperone
LAKKWLLSFGKSWRRSRTSFTEEQQAKLPELKAERRERARDRLAARIANFRELNLTGEQRTAIAEIRKEYRPKIQETGNQLRATVKEEVAMILAVIRDDRAKVSLTAPYRSVHDR